MAKDNREANPYVHDVKIPEHHVEKTATDDDLSEYWSFAAETSGGSYSVKTKSDTDECTATYVNYVKRDLADKYGMDESEAQRLLTLTGFIKLISEHPNQVTHYNTEHWAKLVHDRLVVGVDLAVPGADLTCAIKTLKAIQREAREATKALRELESELNNRGE